MTDIIVITIITLIYAVIISFVVRYNVEQVNKLEAHYESQVQYYKEMCDELQRRNTEGC